MNLIQYLYSQLRVQQNTFERAENGFDYETISRCYSSKQIYFPLLNSVAVNFITVTIQY